MHELSLAWDVIEIASREAEKSRIGKIHEIKIEIGRLSGVEAEIFVSALDMIRRETLLDQARIDIVTTPGKGKCISCNSDFEMQELFSPCPKCGGNAFTIIGGREFRVLSLLAD